MADSAKLVENLPVELNLGQPEQIIGWASASRDPETGKTTIEIVLDEVASEKLMNLVEVFELKAVGFAGVKRRSHDRAPALPKPITSDPGKEY